MKLFFFGCFLLLSVSFINKFSLSNIVGLQVGTCVMIAVNFIENVQVLLVRMQQIWLNIRSATHNKGMISCLFFSGEGGGGKSLYN